MASVSIKEGKRKKTCLQVTAVAAVMAMADHTTRETESLAARTQQFCGLLPFPPSPGCLITGISFPNRLQQGKEGKEGGAGGEKHVTSLTLAIPLPFQPCQGLDECTDGDVDATNDSR